MTLSSASSARIEPGLLMASPGQVLVAWVLEPGAILALVRTPTALALSGQAFWAEALEGSSLSNAASMDMDFGLDLKTAQGRVSDRNTPSLPAVYQALVWNAPGETSHSLALVALRIPERDVAWMHQSLLFPAQNGRAYIPIPLPDIAADPLALAAELARCDRTQSSHIARFIFEVFPPDVMARLPQAGAFMRAFLTQAAVADGCIEIMAPIPGVCVILQGWGATLDPMVEVILSCPTVPKLVGHTGVFDRQDISAPSTGIFIALAPEAAKVLLGTDHVFVLSKTAIHSRELVERRILGADESVGHLRHMAPKLQGSVPLQALVREALRPRYTGEDTLTGSVHPVRVAVDFCAAQPNIGAYVSGWLYDAADLVQELTLCAGTARSRLDLEWTRISRADVSEAFTAQPWPRPRHVDHGFAVFVPWTTESLVNAHLECVLHGGDRVFIPLLLSDPRSLEVRATLLQSIDLHKPSGMSIVERHLAPFLSNIRLPDASVDVQVVQPGPLGRPHAMVIPLLGKPRPIRALLSQFLLDPMGPDEVAVFVCGEGWHAASLDGLRRLVAFYRIPATILSIDDTLTAPQAIRLAATQVQAETVLVSSPTALGMAPGWRGALRRAAPKDAVACPTLVYEDWSLRYAGAPLPTALDRPPYVDLSGPLTGLPASLVGHEGVEDSPIGTLECCLFPRAALQLLGNESPAMTTTDGDSAALFFYPFMLLECGVYGCLMCAYMPQTPPIPVPMLTASVSLSMVGLYDR